MTWKSLTLDDAEDCKKLSVQCVIPIVSILRIPTLHTFLFGRVFNPLDCILIS